LEAHFDGTDFCAALLFGGGWVNTCQNQGSLVDFAMSDELARRLWAKGQKSCKDNGWHSTDSDCCPPSLRLLISNLSKSSAQGGCNELASRYTAVVERHHTAPVLGWRKLGDIQGNYHRSATNPKTDDETAYRKLRKMVGGGLEDSSDNKDDAGEPDGHFATKFIRHQPCDDGSDQSASRCERCNKLLFR
jgi:hypothetical protein